MLQKKHARPETIAGLSARAYLRLAAEAASQGQWAAASANAKEAAKYAEIEQRIGRVPRSPRRRW